ncbi:MAG: hypothetical protein JW963_02730 [Anaerolineales bacterium]|nr:hypothetical protein [Anaerolineales bacterium]
MSRRLSYVLLTSTAEGAVNIVPAFQASRSCGTIPGSQSKIEDNAKVYGTEIASRGVVATTIVPNLDLVKDDRTNFATSGNAPINAFGLETREESTLCLYSP